MNVPFNLYYFPAVDFRSLGMILADHGARIGSTLSEANLRKWNDAMLALADQDGN